MKKYAVSLLLFVFGICVLSANVGAQESRQKRFLVFRSRRGSSTQG